MKILDDNAAEQARLATAAQRLAEARATYHQRAIDHVREVFRAHNPHYLTELDRLGVQWSFATDRFPDAASADPIEALRNDPHSPGIDCSDPDALATAPLPQRCRVYLLGPDLTGEAIRSGHVRPDDHWVRSRGEHDFSLRYAMLQVSTHPDDTAPGHSVALQLYETPQHPPLWDSNQHGDQPLAYHLTHRLALHAVAEQHEAFLRAAGADEPDPLATHDVSSAPVPGSCG